MDTEPIVTLEFGSLQKKKRFVLNGNLTEGILGKNTAMVWK